MQNRTVEQFVDVSIPQFQDEFPEVFQSTPQERISERIVNGRTSESYGRTDRGRLHSPDSGGNFPKPEVLGKVVVSCVAMLVLTSCGMHSTWHRFCVLMPPVPKFESRLHSAHTGSMLPTTLWGKSPCEVAECHQKTAEHHFVDRQ